jgi:hypothetical protein
MVVESSSDNLRQLYSGRFVAVEVASCGNQGPARNRRRSASLDALWRVPTPARNVAPEANMIKLGCWARRQVLISRRVSVSACQSRRLPEFRFKSAPLFKLHCETDRRLFYLEPLRQNLCGISNIQPFADHPFAKDHQLGLDAFAARAREQAAPLCSGNKKRASPRRMFAARPFGLTSARILTLRESTAGAITIEIPNRTDFSVNLR